ncbi:SPOR domain-containing protein [Aquicoccus sp. SCR17]|nr:SPOR domain-containing protein [Carideicomes alvinocaridis]
MADDRRNGGGARAARLVLLAGALSMLGACGEGTNPLGFLSRDSSGETGAAGDGRSVRLVERDVEAPDVFQVTEAGLWDGRPSLGGVWVAHPDVKEPERVIIRNTTNRNFVIGALFRKERDTPGPRLQVSSDAAEALGMLAGKPVNLNVTALRREEVENGPQAGAEAEMEASAALDAPAAISESTLDPAVAPAAAALDAAEAEAPGGTATEMATAAPETAAPTPAPRPAASSLDRPYIQIGIFSVEQNASNTAEAMRQAGMVPTVRKQTSQGKTFWRVVVGPAQSADERAALLDKIKAAGFTDAYAVTD